MLRYFAPSMVVFALATAAHAQTYVTRTYTATDGRGNSTSTTIEAPSSVAGLIAGQTIYGGFPSYANGVPSYGSNCAPVYNSGYAGYSYPNAGYGCPAPGYGYGYSYPAPYGYYPPPAPYPTYPYGYVPQAYYVPGQTTYLPGDINGPFTPPSITSLPEVITIPAVPPCPYGAYVPYNYGWGSRTTTASGGVTYQRNGVTLSVGGSTTQGR